MIHDIDWKTAIYNKNWISTLEALWDKTFLYTYFSATDEDWNTTSPTDSNTNFDDEDKKTNLIISVIPAEAPNLTDLWFSDNYIGGTWETTSIISFTWSQDWTSKVALDSCEQTDTNKIFQDWTTYITPNIQDVVIDSSKLSEWSNSIFVCIKNDWLNTWSFNAAIIKDTVAPTVNNVTYVPSSVILNNSAITFQCNEDWFYKIDRLTPTGLNINDYTAILANTNTTVSINNANLEIWTNNFKITCKDNASNTSEYTNITIIKQEPTPSMSGEVTLFEDSDIDLNWLDWRDINLTWNTTIWTNFAWFESWRIYLLPSNVTLDTATHNYIKLITSSTTWNFTWDISLVNDSAWNAFVSWGSYKAYVSIMWTTWMLWDPWISTIATLTSDVVHNATITSAKFTSDTNLELTTDTTLDTVLSSHSGALISYQVDWITKTWISIASVNWTKLNITIPSLWATNKTWTNLVANTWAIHSDWGGFNNAQSPIFSITDWINPNITSFTKNTAPVYWNFYNSSINFSWTLSEQLAAWWLSYLEFIRTWWNADNWTNHKSTFTSTTDLASWAHTKSINLNQDDSDNVVLTCWTTYKTSIFAKDLAWNSNISPDITNIIFDNCAPTIPTQIPLTLESTLTPTISWIAAIDDNWNGSGIKEYTLNVYNWNWCTWWINQTYTLSWTSKVLSTLTNIADYSWNVKATDNMLNIWWISTCDDFRVDNSIPAFSNSQINDTTISSTSYITQSDNIVITSNITNTDINHIWLNLSNISWNPAHTEVLCSSAPIDWITCSYSAWLVTYTLTSWVAITDGIKQIQFIVQNTSGWNEQTKIIYTTADSTPPAVSDTTISSPTWIVWWATTNVIWTQSKITDAIWINNIKIEYSRTDNVWNQIYNWANTSPYTWNIWSLASWNDYKLRLTAYDLVWNSTAKIFPNFTIDTTLPVVPSNTIIYPNGNEVLK